MRNAKHLMRSAISGPIFEAFLVSKSSSSWLSGKLYLSNFWNNLIFLIWSSFAPPNIDSPNTASYVEKKWQRGHFLGVFLRFGDQDLVQNSQPFLSMHIFSCWFQKCKPFCKWMPPTKAQCHLLKKPCFFTLKNSKLTKNSPNSLKFGMIDPC